MATLPVSSDTAFQFEGRNVCLIDFDGETWFFASDIARELGYEHVPHLMRILEEDEKGVHITDTPGGRQSVSIISEPGVYHAIMQRRANKAHNETLTARIARFQRFVTHDVLPSIRKTGAYSVAPPTAPALPKSYAEALRELAATVETVERQQAEIVTMAPKADFHDAVAEAVNSQTMEAAAKVLGIGRNNLFKFLRNHKILQQNNRPYQTYLDLGHFSVVERVWRDREDQAHTDTTTLVTGKGLIFLRKKLAEKQIVNASTSVPALPAAATAH
ncbi:phage antirepressor KilAC domain-containing protein [Tardiphaga sp.]|jgi:anti-repressor protein|uniref:phage antirepressor KilAC domain-containing protein n=1 Tax=Tardiphaga sp. TaxID=1926292 RepID=UPI0037D9E163